MKKKIAVLATLLAIILNTFCIVTSADFRYIDVPDGQWYTNAVYYCSERGFMSGTGEGYFSPNVKMSRAMAVQVMAKVGEADLSVYSSVNTFEDVPAESWFHNAVEWAKENAITGGTSPTTFAPNASVTREQCALFLKKFSEYLGNETAERADLSVYTDAKDISSWALDALKWAVDCGFISGTSITTVSPKNVCTRAQLAVIIQKFVTYNTSDCEHDWTEPNCTTGYVCKKCGYTRGAPLGHDYTPKCTQTSTCRRCGKVMPAAGHTAKPDCTHGATCERCGEFFPATGHLHTTVKNARQPTLTVAGYTGDVYCTDCGALVSKGEKIPATLDHVYPDEEKELLKMCNDLRKSAGLPALKWKEQIYPCAALRAHELEKKFSHDRPNGDAFFTVIEDLLGAKYDYTGVSETYSRYKSNRVDLNRVFNMWVNGSDINTSILSPNFKNGTVAIYHSDSNMFYIVLFLEMP